MGCICTCTRAHPFATSPSPTIRPTHHPAVLRTARRSVHPHVHTCTRLSYPVTASAIGAPLSVWGLITPPPPLSREPLVVESRARRHSKAIHKTHPKLLCELKIEVTSEVKVRSKVKIRRFDVLDPGDQDYRTWWFKPRKNVVKGMVKVWYEYKWHNKKISRSRSGHKRSWVRDNM